MHKVRIEQRALRWLRKQKEDVRKPIGVAIDKLQRDLTDGNVKQLVNITLNGLPLHRLRVGDFRVIYQIKQDEVLILVVHIADRKEVYEELKVRVKSRLDFGP